jgi:hypothetical protein
MLVCLAELCYCVLPAFPDNGQVFTAGFEIALSSLWDPQAALRHFTLRHPVRGGDGQCGTAVLC